MQIHYAQFAQYYGQFFNKLLVPIHQIFALPSILPLPYHTYSYLITRSIVAVQQISADKAKKFLDNIYNGDQDQFDLPDKCENDVVKLVASYVERTLSIPQADFLQKYEDSDSLARIEFKFAASQRVNGTPICFLNGVESDLGAGTPFSTWKSVIDELIAN